MEDLSDSVYISKVPFDFGSGYYVEAEGVTKEPCKEFALNFLLEKSLSSDISLHFNPRLEQNEIVRNCFINNDWGSEEIYSITPYHKYDLGANSKFKFEVFVTNSEYVLLINGNYVCQFSFRILPRKVNFIQFTGDCEIKNVNFKNLSILPQLGCGKVLTRDNEILTFNNAKRILDVPSDFGPGYYVEVKGYVLKDPKRFDVNFLLDKSYENVSFHLNPRHLTLDIRTIIRNDCIDDVWGIEETDTHSSFENIRLFPETEFHIGIIVTSKEYLVEINGKYVCQFAFRLHPSKVRYLEIRADCEVYDVAFRNLSVFPKLFPK